jgi:biopolymer transport protein ExbB
MDLVALLSYADKGGVIVYILVLLSLVGFTIMTLKLMVIAKIKSNKERVVDSFLTRINKDENFTSSVEKNVASYVANLEKGLNTVKIIASVAPLMGLLGTVIGVLEAFEAIGKSGLGDPSVFASGISLALITTIAGLLVAIPHYIGYNYLVGALDTLEIELEKDIINRA